MLGAIIGDIVGSVYEFNPTNDYNFEMFKEGSKFTDDTICTIAIADALLKGKDYGESLHEWCRRYMTPKGGFGGRFRRWVESDDPKPYGSFGNGSAMRVSPIGMWFCNDSKKVNQEAKESAECTHNHPEGIKGAQAVAQAICRAIRFSENSSDIGFGILCDYGYDVATNYENSKNNFNETCQGTIPPAFDIIRRSSGFEDAIRKAVSLGADADTLGAIVGSIAEHIWGIPDKIKQEALEYLPSEMRKVVDDFYFTLENREGSADAFAFDRKACYSYNRAVAAQLYYSYGGNTGMLPGRVAREKIDKLGENEIFVFGSNKQGHHTGGAAYAALKKFGAVYGVGNGLKGQSYAISTSEGLIDIAVGIRNFLIFAAHHQELKFYVTPIGCGHAGYNPLQIAPLFREALALPNVYLPRIFWEYFWMVEGYGPDYFIPNEDWKKWEKK